MKTYIKPEISVENLFSVKSIASNDPFDFVGGVGGGEADVSATPWFDLLGGND